MEITKNNRITKYLTKYLSEYIFDELSPEYMNKTGLSDIMQGVPIPIEKNDLMGISVLKIAENMAFVMGADPEFKYRDNYVRYILKNFDEKFAQGLIMKGMKLVEREEFEKAAIQFRAAIIIAPENGEAYYLYGRALKDSYETAESETEEYVGLFKAEAIEAFETATLKDTDLGDAFYYLGYSYVNMGLYKKAQLTWEHYVTLTDRVLSNDPPKDQELLKEMQNSRKEIKDRLRQLEMPVKIESGCNCILAGRYADGINILNDYREGDFAKWWPLWYYLGVAYKKLGEMAEINAGGVDELVAAAYEEAEADFLEVLKLSPSNQDVMEELIDIYHRLEEPEKVEKYSRKLELVRKNAFEDRELVAGNGDKLN